MTLTKPLPRPTTTNQRSRSADSDAIRRRALERLYERRTAVDHLIESLERYQECGASRPRAATRVTELAMRKCS